MRSRFVKEQEAKGLLSNLGIKTLLNKIPLFNVCLKVIKMNEIVNKFLLAGNKFVRIAIKTTWIYLQCLWSIYQKQRKIEKFMQAGNTDFIY